MSETFLLKLTVFTSGLLELVVQVCCELV